MDEDCLLLDLLQTDLFHTEVLERLDPMDRTMLAQVGRPWLAAVLASGLPRMPAGWSVWLRLREYCTSVDRLAWAKANRCGWGEPIWTGMNNPCALAAAGGHLEVLQWARQHGCPWGRSTCLAAARGGHLEVLQWARQHDCPWDSATCEHAAFAGRLEMLQWARQHDCPWDSWTCACAAASGHLETLQWARQHDCPWDKADCEFTRSRNHHDTLQQQTD